MRMFSPITKDSIDAWTKENELKKEMRDFCYTDKTSYFKLMVDNQVIGFTGFIVYKNKLVFKNSFIHPDHRRKGYFAQIQDFRIDKARKVGVKFIEATCTKMSLPDYIKRGASVLKEYKLYTKVRLDV